MSGGSYIKIITLVAFYLNMNLSIATQYRHFESSVTVTTLVSYIVSEQSHLGNDNRYTKNTPDQQKIKLVNYSNITACNLNIQFDEEDSGSKKTLLDDILETANNLHFRIDQIYVMKVVKGEMTALEAIKKLEQAEGDNKDSHQETIEVIKEYTANKKDKLSQDDLTKIKQLSELRKDLEENSDQVRKLSEELLRSGVALREEDYFNSVLLLAFKIAKFNNGQGDYREFLDFFPRASRNLSTESKHDQYKSAIDYILRNVHMSKDNHGELNPTILDNASKTLIAMSMLEPFVNRPDLLFNIISSERVKQNFFFSQLKGHKGLQIILSTKLINTEEGKIVGFYKPISSQISIKTNDIYSFISSFNDNIFLDGNERRTFHHELAHALDYDSELADLSKREGILSANMDEDQIELYKKIRSETKKIIEDGEYQTSSKTPASIWLYALTDDGEFFAVMFETYIHDPEALNKTSPKMYDFLKGFLDD
jgi:hypothetical protein